MQVEAKVKIKVKLKVKDTVKVKPSAGRECASNEHGEVMEEGTVTSWVKSNSGSR